MIASVILRVLPFATFWFPLLLSVKLISDLKNTPKYGENGIFLLNYWLCYVVCDRITGWVVEMDWKVMLASELFKSWLFYNHGCLMINYYFIDGLFRNVFIQRNSDYTTLQVFETKLIDPLVDKFILNNYLLQFFFRFFNNIRSPWLSSMVGLNKELKAKYLDGQQTVLDISINYLCFIDNEESLDRSYQNSLYFMKSVGSLLFVSKGSIDVVQERPITPSPTVSPPRSTPSSPRSNPSSPPLSISSPKQSARLPRSVSSSESSPRRSTPYPIKNDYLDTLQPIHAAIDESRTGYVPEMKTNPRSRSSSMSEKLSDSIRSKIIVDDLKYNKSTDLARNRSVSDKNDLNRNRSLSKKLDLGRNKPINNPNVPLVYKSDQSVPPKLVTQESSTLLAPELEYHIVLQTRKL